MESEGIRKADSLTASFIPVSSTSTTHTSVQSTLEHAANGQLKNGCNDISEIHIPPPAGFDNPTRPSTLLAALVRGPVSLDESTLSPTTQKRLAYVHKIRAEEKENVETKFEGKENAFPDIDFLPTSPLSPPSPFQHPFFRRQLGLLPLDPWSRFSGFGLPRLNPLFSEPLNRDLRHLPPPDNRPSKKSADRKRNKYRMSNTNNVLCYNQDTKTYKVCRETHFFSTYSDGVSETESEDEDESNQPFSTPLSDTKNHLLLQLSRNTHSNDTQGVGGNSFSSSGEDVLPCSSTSSICSSSNIQSSSNSNTVGHLSPKKVFRSSQSLPSDGDDGSKRLSQAISSEADVDDMISLTSEPDSFHDAHSPRSSFYSLDAVEVTQDDTRSAFPEESLRDNDGESFLKSSVEVKSSVDSPQREASSRKDKLHKIAIELLQTERTYVDVLHLIDQEFQFRVDQQNRVHHLFPPDQMPLMFANIKSIYKLHHDFLLPQLEERMAQFDSCRRIGDIMKSFAPFLKMYTEYVRNFDTAMTYISTWQAKNAKFASIMDEIHQLKACGNLSLQHHMLSPVQRIPRYEMLLRDYLRKLPEDDPDKQDTEEALHLVSTAANHANDAMKKIDKFQKLLEVQESLGGAVELVSPTRELLKEGRIIKISARSGDHQERYLFLLSDLLLLCTPRLIGGRVISSPHYRLRARYKVENLEVLEGDNLETANSFYIRDNSKTVELYTQTKEEKEAWLTSLFDAIDVAYQRKSSLRLTSSLSGSQSYSCDPDLGLKQPILIKADSVSKCMQCGSHFTVVRRKHHCRACGSVVCNKCSGYKAPLTCESGKTVRVCKTCHEALKELGSGTPGTSLSLEVDLEKEDKEVESGQSGQSCNSSRPESTDGGKFEHLMWKSRGVLEISGDAPGAIMKGYLQLKTHRKAWVKRWFALHQDFVLYSFKFEEDSLALTATPVPGFTVVKLLNSKQNTKGESGLAERDKERGLKLFHTKKQYVFLCPTKEDAAKWFMALQKASKAEIYTPED